MRIKFLGGAGEIGASCTLLEMEDRHGRPLSIMLDCGMRPMSEGNARLPLLDSIDSSFPLKGIFISHAHLDHIGVVPYLLKQYPKVPIYCTQPTRDIMHVLLMDSARLMAAGENSDPLYNEYDVQYAMENVRVLEFNNSLTIAPGVKIWLMQAGHILGASAIFVKAHGTRLLYTGDYSTQAMKAVGPQMFSRYVSQPDILITEGTYGNSVHPPVDEEAGKLAATIQSVTANGGKVLIPAFSVGRSQEVLLQLIKQRLEVPLYVDGMIQTINLIHEVNQSFLHPSLRFRADNSSIFSSGQFYQVYAKQRSSIIENTEPCVILSSGGMLSGGASTFYAGQILQNEKNMIALVGHQDPCTPGGRLLAMASNEMSGNINAGKNFIDINGYTCPVRCKVEKFNFSAHAGSNDILSVVEAIRPTTIFLVHGNSGVLQQLAAKLHPKVDTVIVPSVGESYQSNAL